MTENARRAPNALGNATPNDDGERALIESARAGNREAFGMLVNRHLARALGLAQRVLHHREDAEDVVQDAFLSALEHLEAFDVSRQFWPWFARIVVHRALDRASARSVRFTEPLPETAADRGASPAEAAEHREVLERFRHELALLPPRQQLVVRLVELDGYSIGAIAELLDSTPAAVRWNLHAGRQRLRAALSHFRDNDRGGRGGNR